MHTTTMCVDGGGGVCAFCECVVSAQVLCECTNSNISSNSNSSINNNINNSISINSSIKQQQLIDNIIAAEAE